MSNMNEARKADEVLMHNASNNFLNGEMLTDDDLELVSGGIKADFEDKEQMYCPSCRKVHEVSYMGEKEFKSMKKVSVYYCSIAKSFYTQQGDNFIKIGGIR